MDTTTELTTWTEANNTNLITILLTEEGYSTHLLCFFHRCVTVFVHRIISTNHSVNKSLHLTKFLIGDLLEVRNVETERVWTNVRTFLLCMITKNLFQSIVQQVSRSVISSRCITLFYIHTSHKVGFNILW